MSDLDLFVVALLRDGKKYYFTRVYTEADGPLPNFDSRIGRARVYHSKNAALSSIRNPSSWCKSGPYPLVIYRLKVYDAEPVYEQEPVQ